MRFVKRINGMIVAPVPDTDEPLVQAVEAYERLRGSRPVLRLANGQRKMVREWRKQAKKTGGWVAISGRLYDDGILRYPKLESACVA